jgi:hypothetical protein
VSGTKKPKVQIKREKTSPGWAYRIYIVGMLMGASLSRAQREHAATAGDLREDHEAKLNSAIASDPTRDVCFCGRCWG